jgi:hypothetical protein
VLLTATDHPHGTTGPRPVVVRDPARPPGLCWRLLAMSLLPAPLLALLLAGSPLAEVRRTVSLADLVVEQDRHDGTLVTTGGVVRSYDEQVHFLLEAAEQHRIELFLEVRDAPPQAAIHSVAPAIDVSTPDLSPITTVA